MWEILATAYVAYKNEPNDYNHGRLIGAKAMYMASGEHNYTRQYVDATLMEYNRKLQDIQRGLPTVVHPANRNMRPR